jgi:hypothetical protein
MRAAKELSSIARCCKAAKGVSNRGQRSGQVGHIALSATKVLREGTLSGLPIPVAQVGLGFGLRVERSPERRLQKLPAPTELLEAPDGTIGIVGSSPITASREGPNPSAI